MGAALRDRILTRPVANAIMSPSAILATGAGTALGLLALGPLGAVLGGVLFFGGRVALSIPRAKGRERIDAFRLDEPWRRLVIDAEHAESQFAGAVRRTARGPLRDRLTTLHEQVSDGVSECWRVAQAGHAMSTARSNLDIAAIGRDLEELHKAGYSSETTAETETALQSQLDTAKRMDETIVQTRDRLRLLDARLDEAVTRAIELGVSSAEDSALDSVGADLTTIAGDMDALRQGLEATETRPAGGS